MSKCSKKCNEIKEKIDSISGLDDDYVYFWLNHLDNYVLLVTSMLSDYADKDELHGTCFNDENLEEAIKHLEEYISLDVVYQSYKDKRENVTDFEKYCIKHCEDIDIVLNAIKKN